MSVGTIDNKTTTYFVDASSSAIAVPAGVYEATSGANLTLGDTAGNSFIISDKTVEICAQDGLTKVIGSSPLSPTDWFTANFDTALASKTVAGVFAEASGYTGVATDMTSIKSSNGKFFDLDSEYNPTYDAPEVLWTGTSDAQAIPGNQLTFPTTPALQQGDIVIVLAGSDASMPNEPSGWTTSLSTTNSDQYARLIYKVMGATPDANVYVDGLSEASAMVAVAVRNLGSDMNGLKLSASTNAGSSGMPNAPSVTTTEPNTLVIAFGALDDESVADSVTAPAGYTNLVVEEAAGLTGQTVMAASKLVAVAGVEDPAIFGGTGDERGIAYTMKLGPTPYFGSISGAQKAGDKYFASVGTDNIAYSDDLNSWSVGTKTGEYYGAPQYLYANGSSYGSGSTWSIQPYIGTTWQAGDIVFYNQGIYSSGTVTLTSPDVDITLLRDYQISNARIRTSYFVIPEGKSVANDGGYPITLSSYHPNQSQQTAGWTVWRNVSIPTIRTVQYGHYGQSIDWPALTTATTGGGGAGVYTYNRDNNNGSISFSNTADWQGQNYGGSNNIYMAGIFRNGSTPMAPGEVMEAPNSSNSGSTSYNAVVGISFNSPGSSDSFKFASNGTGNYVGIGGAELFTSSDGVDWTVSAASPWGRYLSATDITVSNGRYVISTSGSKLFHGTNGTSWTQRDLTSTDPLPFVSVNEANGITYAVNSAGSYFYSSNAFASAPTYQSMVAGASGASGATGVVSFVGSTQWGGQTGVDFLGDSQQGVPYGYFTQNYSPNTYVQVGDLIIFSMAKYNSSQKFVMETKTSGWKLLAQTQVDTGNQSNQPGMDIQSYYKFAGDDGPVNITIDQWLQYTLDTSLQDNSAGNASATMAVFRGADPAQPLMAATKSKNTTVQPAQLPSIPVPHMQVAMAHTVSSWYQTPGLSNANWTGYENLDQYSDSNGSAVMATKWFPTGGQGVTSQWYSTSDNYIYQGHFTSMTVAIMPLAAATSTAEEGAAAIASHFASRATDTVAIGGGYVLSVDSTGATPTYLTNTLGGASYSDLLGVGNQFLAVGVDKNIKYSGQISESATLKLTGQVVKV